MVSLKRAKEMLYKDICDVYESIKNTEDYITSTKEVEIFKQIPCKLSFSNSSITSSTDTASGVSQAIKVFMSPEFIIKAGSTMYITRNDETFRYKSSSEPIVFYTHQEIELELYKEHA